MLRFLVPPYLNLSHPTTWLASWFGLGFLRPAPGTWGSIGAIPFGLLMMHHGGYITLAIASIILFIIGFFASRYILRQSGSDTDPQIIVVDEVVGQWLALMAATLNPLSILLSFALFRFFDALKPWPVSFFDQKMPGAWGVMLDDVAAGLMAAIVLFGLHLLLGPVLA